MEEQKTSVIITIGFALCVAFAGGFFMGSKGAAQYMANNFRECINASSSLSNIINDYNFK